MTGADNFIANNFSQNDTAFNNCLHLIVYSYLKILESKIYSRKEILKLTSMVRKKKTKQIELEDFLRNDLVSNFIEPNRKLFGLDYYIFQSGAEEFLNNIKIGVLDIKVCSPLLNGNTYFVFECKRLNKRITDNYIKDGLVRFVEEKYYPDSDNIMAGMISFLESTKISERILKTNSFAIMDGILKKYEKEVMLKDKLRRHRLVCNKYRLIHNFKYIYLSCHSRVKNPSPIHIFHIVLDYNDIITD